MSYIRISSKYILFLMGLAAFSLLIKHFHISENPISYNLWGYKIYTTMSFMLFAPALITLIIIKTTLNTIVALNTLKLFLLGILTLPKNLFRSSQSPHPRHSSILAEIEYLKQNNQIKEATHLASNNSKLSKEILYQYLHLLITNNNKRAFIKEFQKYSCFKAVDLLETLYLKNLKNSQKLKIITSLHRHHLKNQTITYLYAKHLSENDKKVEAQSTIENFLSEYIEHIEEPECTKKMQDLHEQLKAENLAHITLKRI